MPHINNTTFPHLFQRQPLPDLLMQTPPTSPCFTHATKPTLHPQHSTAQHTSLHARQHPSKRDLPQPPWRQHIEISPSFLCSLKHFLPAPPFRPPSSSPSSTPDRVELDKAEVGVSCGWQKRKGSPRGLNNLLFHTGQTIQLDLLHSGWGGRQKKPRKVQTDALGNPMPHPPSHLTSHRRVRFRKRLGLLVLSSAETYIHTRSIHCILHSTDQINARFMKP